MDQKLGIKSICFNEQKFAKFLKDEDALASYMRNICIKLNLRCGNWNHTVRFAKDSQMEKILASTLVLGADVTHPPSGSAFGCPSIAAVVGSVDKSFAQFAGSMRLNPSRQEWIAEMKSMVIERLQDWFTRRGGLPENILFYRDGVSEGYFSLIRKYEVPGIREAFAQVYEQNRRSLLMQSQTVKVTTVIVIKRHHRRFYPTIELEDKYRCANGNCRAAFLVDSGVTSPYHFDFFLQSHNVLAGTGRPAHYFVIDNGTKMRPEQLQDFTHHLCFAYGKGNSAVSYATPAYYADRLCERGRLYLQPFHDAMRTNGMADSKNQSITTEEDLMKEAKSKFDNGSDRSNPWHENHDGKMFWM